jgi:hypothetical protein
MITTVKELITPEIAAKYLEVNSSLNRNVNPRHLAKLVRDMNDDRFRDDVVREPIQFNTSGELCNGQHRLRAIIETGNTYTFTVEYNVPDNNYEYMDQGLARSLNDNLKLAGAKDSKLTTSFINLWSRLLATGDPHLRYTPTNSEGVQTWKFLGQTRIDPYIAAGRKVAKETRNKFQVGAVLKMVHDHENITASSEFWNTYIRKSDFRHGEDDPISRLLQFLESEYTNRVIMIGRHGSVFSELEALAWTQFTWESWKSNKEVIS